MNDDISHDMFKQYVSEAIDHIPKMYQEKMKQVAILVEDEPTDEQKTHLTLNGHGHLFGLYEGVPLPARGGTTFVGPPDRITIFRYPMMHMYPKPEDLKRQIYKTLWHEVAHYFGLDHDAIEKAQKRKYDRE